MSESWPGITTSNISACFVALSPINPKHKEKQQDYTYASSVNSWARYCQLSPHFFQCHVSEKSCLIVDTLRGTQLTLLDFAFPKSRLNNLQCSHASGGFTILVRQAERCEKKTYVLFVTTQKWYSFCMTVVINRLVSLQGLKSRLWAW